MSDQKPPSEPVSPAQLKRYKQEAKKYKKNTGCTHSEALDYVVREKGFNTWKATLKEADIQGTLNTPAPQTSFGFVDDIVITDKELESLQSEHATVLSPEQRLLLADNQSFLAGLGIEYSLFEPTSTGLSKSILDATQPVRTHFLLEAFHDYDNQPQGPDHKVVKEAVFIQPDQERASKVSLYRPNSKNGDPRMWFSKLGGFSIAGDQIAITIFEGRAYLLNLTQHNLSQSAKSDDKIGLYLTRKSASYQEISSELLSKLKLLAKEPLEAVGHGDTTIGMTIEAALGIEANSSKLPDYKGIELKAGRGTRNRANLFAQVADWSVSACKSSADILDKYGYQRDDDFKLYCTVSTQRTNTQGLSFAYHESTDELHEVHNQTKQVAIWSGHLLRDRLAEKHAETFWIQATSETINSKEYFSLKSVTHTKRPLLSQLMPLIQNGVITMDHLIKRKGGAKPRVSEKGPLFKIDKRNLSMLFPEPIKYSLVD